MHNVELKGQRRPKPLERNMSLLKWTSEATRSPSKIPSSMGACAVPAERLSGAAAKSGSACNSARAFVSSSSVKMVSTKGEAGAGGGALGGGGANGGGAGAIGQKRR